MNIFSRGKSIVTRVLLKFILNSILSIRNRLLGRPPLWSDIVGYESLINVIEEKQIYALEGDVVEIGSFFGGGTAKLAKFFNNHDKVVYTIDVFNPIFDSTSNVSGNLMSEIYLKNLKGKDQFDIFKKVTKKYSNIVVIKENSMKVTLPLKKICFSFIDGCHMPKYVKNDFYLVWDKIVPGGIVGLHDYGGDLPQVTKVIDELIKVNQNNIIQISRIKEKWIIFLTKR